MFRQAKLAIGECCILGMACGGRLLHLQPPEGCRCMHACVRALQRCSCGKWANAVLPAGLDSLKEHWRVDWLDSVSLVSL